MDRPVFLSGQVVLEDGTPPPEQVLVQRACDGGRPIPQGYTDAGGQFSFELGRNRSLAMDAQNAMAVDPFGSSGSRGNPGFAQPNGPALEGGTNPRDLTGCELRVQVPGFHLVARDLSGRRVMDSPDVGTLVLRRLPGVQESFFSPTTLQARKEARTAFEKGRALARGKKLDDALKEYEKAVRTAPAFAAAWFELGLVHQMLNHTADARKAYGEALLADPRFIKPYRQIALLSLNEQNWREVVDATDRWIGLDPVVVSGGLPIQRLREPLSEPTGRGRTERPGAGKVSRNGRFPERATCSARCSSKRDYAAPPSSFASTSRSPSRALTSSGPSRCWPSSR